MEILLHWVDKICNKYIGNVHNLVGIYEGLIFINNEMSFLYENMFELNLKNKCCSRSLLAIRYKAPIVKSRFETMSEYFVKLEPYFCLLLLITF